MSTRRMSLLTALAAAGCLVTSSLPAGASLTSSPGLMNRGDRRGQAPPDGTGDQADSEEATDECPTELWTIPLEIKGLACILVLGKPAGEESAE